MSKGSRREAIFEAVAELIMTLIFFGIGIGIVSLFGVDIALDSVDPDLMILIGIAGFIVVFAAVYMISRFIKKKKRSRKDASESAEKILGGEAENGE